MSANTEIERKFLVDPAFAATLHEGPGRTMEQFFLGEGFDPAVRVRIVGGQQAWLTIKGRVSGVSAAEFEYAIPVADAREMRARLNHSAVIEKSRYEITHGDHVWEIDVFVGANQGLVVAEIELESEDAAFDRPAWLGDEVSHDHRYKNVSLARVPFSTWTDD